MRECETNEEKKIITIQVIDDIDVDEYIKSICFVSDKIQSVTRNSDSINVEITSDIETSNIENELNLMMKKYKKTNINSQFYFKNDIEVENYYQLENNKSDVINFGLGQIGFSNKGKFLLDYADKIFCNIAIDMGAIEKIYPTLLPLKDYLLTGYIKKSPQHAIFCSNVKENLKILEDTDNSIRYVKLNSILSEPQFALSPSACFHTYIEYSDKEIDRNTIVTFRQNVFRNEGRLNYNEIGRLRDYHVREIVLIGNEEYVENCRKKIMDRVVEIMEKWKIQGDISLASDSFIMPKMQKYRKIQQIDKSKFEMHLNVNKDETISTASFNLHGRAFTDPFNIKIKGTENTVTGCVGFGLQRFVIAFICQYGLDENNWPEEVVKSYKKYRGI